MVGELKAILVFIYILYFQGRKKLKKPDSTGAGGHIGCSDGYNYNLYKPSLPYKQPNSQVDLTIYFKLYSILYIPGQRANALEVGKALSKLEADGLHRLHAFSEGVLRADQFDKQERNLEQSNITSLFID